MSLYSIFPVAMGCVCLTVSLHELMIWVRGRSAAFDFSFAVTCMLAGAYNFACAGEYNVSTPLASGPWLRVQAIALTLTAFSFIWYLSDRTGKVRTSHFAAFAAWAALGTAVQAIGFGDLTWNSQAPLVITVHLPFGIVVRYLELQAGLLTDIQYSSGVAAFGYFLWVTHRYGREDPHEARRLYRLLGIVCAAYLNDVAVAAGLYAFLYVVQYGWLAAVIFVTAQRSRELGEAAAVKRDLVASEERFRTFVEQSSEAIVMTDEAGTIITYNRAAERLLGMPARECLDKPIWEVALRMLPEAERTEEMRQRIQQRYREVLSPHGATLLPPQVESVLLRPDGSAHSFRHNEFLIRTPGGFRIGTISHDVTEVKRAEDQVLASLREKTVLLQEIHHRVKNNLQIISSLLYLHESHVGEEAARRALQDSRSEVLAMALVHEDLYRSRDFSTIDFSAYLRRLVARLLGALRQEEDITLVPNLPPTFLLDVGQAIPCGLIVNELCTNVVRHAFPPGYPGARRELRLTLTQTDQRVLLTVADTGVGIPEGREGRDPESLGMQIVSSLVRQLEGTLRVTRTDPGTRVDIDFAARQR